jgi:hypothetical protein
MTDNEKIPDYSKEYTTKTGFKLAIVPLPPYYLDVIGDIYPLLELPRWEIPLMAGDIMTKEYEVPETPPDEFAEDYELYLRTMDVKYRNEQVEKQRFRAKKDMLLSMCVHIIDGPESIDDQKWKDDVEAPFMETGKALKVPTHSGAQKLLFLKMIVIRDLEDSRNIQQLATFQEVSIQGIGSALDSFPDNVGRLEALADLINKQEEPVSSPREVL